MASLQGSLFAVEAGAGVVVAPCPGTGPGLVGYRVEFAGDPARFLEIYRHAITCTCDRSRNNLGVPCRHKTLVRRLGLVALARQGVAR